MHWILRLEYKSLKLHHIFVIYYHHTHTHIHPVTFWENKWAFEYFYWWHKFYKRHETQPQQKKKINKTPLHLRICLLNNWNENKKNTWTFISPLTSSHLVLLYLFHDNSKCVEIYLHRIFSKFSGSRVPT